MPLLYHRSILLLTVIPSPPNCRKFASYSPRLKWLLTLCRGGKNLSEMIICKVVGFALFIFLEENTFKSTLLMISLCTHCAHTCFTAALGEIQISSSLVFPCYLLGHGKGPHGLHSPSSNSSKQFRIP